MSFFHPASKTNACTSQINNSTAQDSDTHTAHDHRGRQNQQKMKGPCSCFKKSRKYQSSIALKYGSNLGNTGSEIFYYYYYLFFYFKLANFPQLHNCIIKLNPRFFPRILKLLSEPRKEMLSSLCATKPWGVLLCAER